MRATFDLESQPLVAVRNAVCEFRSTGGHIFAVRGIDLNLQAGELVALQGRSGSGKTTLLNMLIGLVNPTEGEIAIFGRLLKDLSERERVYLRRKHIGVLFQNAHLLPSLTAQENVEISLRLLGTPGRERSRRSSEALEMVGLSGRARHRALELSGGEQQRVALARALVHRPRLIVADEPTGALDLRTGQAIIRLLADLTREHRMGAVVATHDVMMAQKADRTVLIRDGRIV